MTPEYAQRMEKGLRFQDFAVMRLYEAGIPIVGLASKRYQVGAGENMNGFEIKFDDRMKDTGNVYIEVAEKTDAQNDGYVASGIYRNDNSWMYVIGDYSVIYICAKNHLRLVYEREKDRGCSSLARFVETPTSKGMLLPQTYVEGQLASKTLWTEGDRQ